MTRTQSQIIDLFTQLPLQERHELVSYLHKTGLLEESFYARMSPAQRAHLQEGIDQADRNEGEPASVVLDRVAKGLGIPRA